MSGKGNLSRQNSTGGKKVDYGHRRGCTRSCDFGISKRLELSSPVRYLKHIGGKVVAVVVRIRTTAAAAAAAKSHHRNNHPKERAKPSVAPVDSQRAEAIHDCIDFINSSSSLPRSNSVAR